MKIPIINQKEINTINKDKSKIPCFGISFENETIRPKNSDRPIIRMIDERGPSENFLKENDLVLEINKKKIKDIKDFFVKQKNLNPGEIVILRIKRNRQELNRAIRIISLDEFNNPKQKHSVRLGIEFNREEQKKNLRIIAVQKKFISDKILKPDDLIVEINNIKIKNRDEFDNEIKKVIWGEKIKIKINRKNKILDKKIQTTSFEDYKKRTTVFAVETKVFKRKFLKVVEVQEGSFEDSPIKKGDVILSIGSKIMGIVFKKRVKDQLTYTPFLFGKKSGKIKLAGIGPVYALDKNLKSAALCISFRPE